jgi:exodeoxyribonuclease VII large subunit
MMWGSERKAIETKLAQSGSSLALHDGLQVRALCKADFYVPQGKFQLKVIDVDPGFTLGLLALDRKNLLKKLAAAGLLTRNRSLPLASTPLVIGLVTSVGSAAYHDFTKELGTSKFPFRILPINAQMQGAGTPESVCKAIRQLRGTTDSLRLLDTAPGSRPFPSLRCSGFQTPAIRQYCCERGAWHPPNK